MTPPDPIAALVMAQARFLRYVVQRRNIPGADVDGVVAEVLFAAYQAASAGRIDAANVGEFRAWLTTVVQRRAVDYARLAARRAQLEARRPGDTRPDTDTEERYAAREALRFILGRLTPNERTVLEGVAAGFTQAEIAAAERIPAGTVATRLLRARRRLLALLRRK